MFRKNFLNYSMVYDYLWELAKWYGSIWGSQNLENPDDDHWVAIDAYGGYNPHDMEFCTFHMVVGENERKCRRYSYRIPLDKLLNAEYNMSEKLTFVEDA